MLVDVDRTGNIVASVTSHTTERKVKTNLITKHGRLLLQHNAFTCAPGSHSSPGHQVTEDCSQCPA